MSKLKLVTTLWLDVAATRGSLRRWLPMEPMAVHTVRKGDEAVRRGDTALAAKASGWVPQGHSVHSSPIGLLV